MFATETQHGTTRCVDDKFRKKSLPWRGYTAHALLLTFGSSPVAASADVKSACTLLQQEYLHRPRVFQQERATRWIRRWASTAAQLIALAFLRLEVIVFESYTSGTNNSCLSAKSPKRFRCRSRDWVRDIISNHHVASMNLCSHARASSVLTNGWANTNPAFWNSPFVARRTRATFVRCILLVHHLEVTQWKLSSLLTRSQNAHYAHLACFPDTHGTNTQYWTVVRKLCNCETLSPEVDFGSSGRVLRSRFCKMVWVRLTWWSPTTDKQYVSRLVVGRTQFGKLSLKTLNYWMSSVSAFIADQTRRKKFALEIIIAWTVLATLSCNSNPSASPHDSKPSCTFRLWPSSLISSTRPISIATRKIALFRFLQ